MAEPRGSGDGGYALTFVAGGERLAIAASTVSEVVRSPRLARPPLAPAALAGVVGVRGRIIPVVAMSHLLNASRSGAAGEPRVIVVEGVDPVGLLVDEVATIVSCDVLGTAGETARLIDLPALIASQFTGSSARTRPAVATRSGGVAPAAAPVQRLEYLSFEVAGQEFGLPLGTVTEVVALPPEVVAVPRTDGAMCGMMSLRGRLLPLLNLDVLLGLAPSMRKNARKVVVARLGDTRVGLVVDNARSIVRVPASDVDPVPAVLTRGSQEAQVQSVCRLDGGRRLISILSTDHLLRDGLAEQIRIQDSEESQVEETRADEGTEQFLLFQLGENRFGLPLGCVEEVTRVPEQLSPLPKAPSFVDGVIELRGRVIPVIDQRRRFAVPETRTAQCRIVVVRIEAMVAGFVVDSVPGIARLAAGQVQDSPPLAVSDDGTVHRVGSDGEAGMLFVIDPRELLDGAERDIVAAMQKDLAAPS